ncbi:hypothetical protein E2C01_075800 [Portunus trituberculatus]|uniref:Uncharacterized protein n=1 Tax=Portunus trituberculatus TaxID=210409 RepID=A0A5B7ILG0_PORTR|nr:hypothetical protein [Portunus trituberculatus]
MDTKAIQQTLMLTGPSSHHGLTPHASTKTLTHWHTGTGFLSVPGLVCGGLVCQKWRCVGINAQTEIRQRDRILMRDVVVVLGLSKY